MYASPRGRQGLFVALSALLAFACSGSEPNAPSGTSPGGRPSELLTIVLDEPSVSLAEGQAYPMLATVRDSRGVPTIRSITWTSTAPQVASVGAGGIVSAHAPGQARVIASVSGAADTATVTVSMGRLEITPGAVSAVIGSELQFTASLPGGASSSAAMSVAWSSSNPQVAVIDADGMMTSLQEGTVTIHASRGGRNGDATVKVSQRVVESITIDPGTSSIFPDETVRLDASLWNGSGKSVKGRDVHWSSSDPNVAVVQNGEVTGVARGTAILTAAADEARATATVNVLGVPVARIEVELPSSVLSMGATMLAAASLFDASGDALDDRSVAWQSSNPSIATVDADGVVTGVANGNVTINAVSEGKVGSAAMVVATPVASGIVINPTAVSVLEGQQAPLLASVVDQGGSPLAGKTVSWTSDNAGVATVAPDGKVRGVSGGSTMVRAISGSLSAKASVTVTSVPVVAVDVSPNVLSLPAGDDASLVATARDASGNVLAGRPASWSSSNAAVVSVDATGTVLGKAAGTAMVTATIEGQSAQAEVTVTAARATTPEVASITVTLAKSSLALDESTQATAVVRDGQGQVLAGQPIEWDTPAHELIEVSDNGMVTALAAGTAAVTASSGEQMGAATVTIASGDGPPASVASIALSIAGNSLIVGESTQATPVLRDSQGRTLFGRTIAWSVVPGAVASVSPSGEITAVSSGAATITATSEGVDGTASFTVYTMSTAPIASLTVTLNSASLMSGQSTQAFATAQSSTGATITGRTVQWSSTNPSVATVDGSGRVTAVGSGSAGIHAVVSGVSGTASLSVGSSAPVVSSVTVVLASSSIQAGSSTQAVATPRDAGGQVMSGLPVSWTVGGGALVATIASNGVVSGVAAGSAVVTATVNGVAGNATLTVTSGTPSTPPPTGGIDVAVQRFDGQSGTVLVSNAIPLPKGRLFPSDAHKVRVYVNGAEQSVYSEGLKGLHADGSLRSVLIQFQYSVPSSGSVAGQVVLGQARGTTDLGKPTASRTVLKAVALPTDVGYLLSTQINGPTISGSQSTSLGGAYAKYESNFAKYANYHWNLNGASWLENYYDRALIYYAFWVRTANPEYFRRGTMLAVNYRQQYLEPNNNRPSPHWAQMEGLEQHYLLTGDEKSRTSVAVVAQTMTGFHAVLSDTMNTAWLENRIQARVLQAYFLAWRLQAPGDNWSSRLDDALNKVLKTQRADGSYGFPSTCHGSLNFMSGLLNDIYIKIYQDYRADSRLPVAIKRSADYLWTQWVPTAQAFRYLSASCTVGSTNVGGTNPAADLNNLIVTGFSWYGRFSGDASYTQKAVSIFAGGVNGAFLSGTKQFNESYSSSYRHLLFVR